MNYYTTKLYKMVGVKTSSNFYRRGVPNNNVFFGFAVQGNYPIIQPQRLFRPNLYAIQPNVIPPNPNTPTVASSILFDGSQNYLEYPGLTLGTNAFTVQCWFNVNNTISGRNVILGATYGTTNGLNFYVLSDTQITIDRLGVSATTYTVPTINLNTWYYLVYVRDVSNNATLFLNGIRSSTGVQTDTTNYALTNLIGCWKPGALSEPEGLFNGNISNICVTLGALYTTSSSTISIPTTPFTATNNTLLLLNTTSQTTTFIDSSPNNYTVTGEGTPIPTISSLSPF
jgi:hypothetical protein